MVEKIRNFFQNDEVLAHGGWGSRELLCLTIVLVETFEYKNDEVLAHGGGSRELLCLTSCGRKIRKF